MWKRWLPLGIFALLGALLYAGIRMAEVRDPNAIPSPLIGKPLPAFTLPDLHDPSRRIDSTTLRGAPFLLNVWASWCPECRVEHPLIEQLDQGPDVVAAQHGAQQLGGAGTRDQRVLLAAERQRGQVAGLDLGSVVHAGRHAVDQQVQQEGVLACRRCLQQLDQVGGLLRGQRQRRDAEGGAFGFVLAVGVQHGGFLGVCYVG